MNYFFGINNTEFKSELQIPLFQNRKSKPEEIFLFEASIENNSWKIEFLNKDKIENNFYIVDTSHINNSNIFFLAYKKDIKNFDSKKLTNLNNFTDTHPSFRANLKLILKSGGFSSYQSEYPYRMITKTGSIMSPVSSIANTNADKNYIFIKNIFQYPINDNFNAFLVDIKRGKIEEKFSVKTNFTNYFELKKSLIKPEIFLVTDKYLGIPMYVSSDKKHLSFEHTHPPHEYILSQNRFKKVSELKNKILEIIN